MSEPVGDTNKGWTDAEMDRCNFNYVCKMSKRDKLPFFPPLLLGNISFLYKKPPNVISINLPFAALETVCLTD